MSGVMRLRRVAVIAVCVASCFALNAFAAPDTRDDLLSLYAQAHAGNPALQRALAQSGAAGAGAAEARAALLPQWTLKARPQRQSGVTTSTTTSEISQVLVNLAAFSKWQAAQADASAQEAQVRAAEQALLADVAVRYFALLTAQNQLATLEANEAAFSELVRQSEVRVAERLSAPVDVDQARAYHGLSQVATQQAREAVADARQALQQLTGQAPLPLRPLRPDLHPAAPQPANPAEWVDAALATHPLLKADGASVAAAQSRFEAARAAHLPTLGVQVTTVREPLGGVPAGPQSTHTALGLQLTVPLFAGGAMAAQQKQALYNRDLQSAQWEATRRDVVRNVQAQWQAAHGSVFQIANAQAAALAAERALAATRAGQQHGTRTLTDVLNAIQTNGQAQQQLIQSRHRHVVALLLLKQAAGRLTVDDLASVNALLDGGAAGGSQ